MPKAIDLLAIAIGLGGFPAVILADQLRTVRNMPLLDCLARTGHCSVAQAISSISE